MDDARHVAFSRLFGELDDVTPYLALGRKNRFAFDELFDVSNQEDDGSLVKIGSRRHHYGLVCLTFCFRYCAGISGPLTMHLLTSNSGEGKHDFPC